MKQRMKVFVPGPYTAPTESETSANVLFAIDVGEQLWKEGFDPEIPHLFHYWDKGHPKPYEAWIEMTLNRLWHCEAVYYVLGPSKGVSIELEHAMKWGIPIFTIMRQLVKHRDELFLEDPDFDVEKSEERVHRAREAWDKGNRR